MEDYFKVRDYSNLKQGRLIWRSCVICNRDFQVPYCHRDVITTCCKYCQDLKIAWTKMKGRYVLCRVCDKPIWCQPGKTHRYCSKKCKDLAVSIYAWERNTHMPRTGRKKYYGPNWHQQRRLARERDGFRCTRCGVHENEYGKELSVHHKIPFVYFDSYIEANKLENLVSLCEPCHRKVHSEENHPCSFDSNKIKYNHTHNTMKKLRERAKKVIDLLLNTDMTLREISDTTGLSYSAVQAIYRGSAWKSLYDKPPHLIRPRRKAKHAIRNME